MNGFGAYKYYLSVKLHFTKKRFNVFETPATRITFENFSARNDRSLFEKLSKKFDTYQQLIQYYVSNLSIGNLDFVYDVEQAEYNYIQWKSYKESREYRFKMDLLKILEHSETNNIDFYNATWKCYVQKTISIQTIHICNELDQVLSKIDETSVLLFDDDILRISKLKGFIKIEEAYRKIYDDLRSN